MSKMSSTTPQHPNEPPESSNPTDKLKYPTNSTSRCETSTPQLSSSNTTFPSSSAMSEKATPSCASQQRRTTATPLKLSMAGTMRLKEATTPPASASPLSTRTDEEVRMVQGGHGQTNKKKGEEAHEAPRRKSTEEKREADPAAVCSEWEGS